MLTRRDVDKLRSVRAAEASVLSLYLSLPPDPERLPQVPAHAAGLIGTLGRSGPGVAAEDQRAVQEALRSILPAHQRERLGQTIAIFACDQIGLLEVLPVPGHDLERVVLATRPHVRPLLAALQRNPVHWIVIIDQRHAWLLLVTEDGIESLARVPCDTAPDSTASPCRGGWYGPASYHAGQRVTELSRHPYRDAAAVLARTVVLGANAGPGRRQPLVIGGYTDGIRHLLAELPGELRASYAGCFAADPHALTLARARDLAAPVIAHWSEQRERTLAAEVVSAAADGSGVIGLPGCLAAVEASRVHLLLVRDEAMLPGYHCERCDALSLTSDGCADWGAASLPVPDLLEEMVGKTLTDGGDVVSARSVPCDVAAGLR